MTIHQPPRILYRGEPKACGMAEMQGQHGEAASWILPSIFPHDIWGNEGINKSLNFSDVMIIKAGTSSNLEQVENNKSSEGN